MSGAPKSWLQPAVHPVYARLLCVELRRRGFSPADILMGTRVSWQSLHEHNEFLSFEQMRRLVVQAIHISQCPWLGMEVGLQTQASAHGALGTATIASHNLAQALALVQRYASLRQSLVNARIETGNSLCLVVDEYLMHDDVREYLLGQLVAGISQLLATVIGSNLRESVRIEWPFPRPVWAEEYQRLATTNQFGCDKLRIHVDSALLNSPSLAADEEALHLATRECERQLQRQHQGGSLSQRVRQRLASCEGGMPSLEAMAEIEHVSPRTFIRHLQAERQTYQALLDDVRQELACWLLLQTDASIEAIAEQLGYVDTSNFSRTFRRWLGLTPSAFREAQGVIAGA